MKTNLDLPLRTVITAFSVQIEAYHVHDSHAGSDSNRGLFPPLLVAFHNFQHKCTKYHLPHSGWCGQGYLLELLNIELYSFPCWLGRLRKLLTFMLNRYIIAVLILI